MNARVSPTMNATPRGTAEVVPMQLDLFDQAPCSSTATSVLGHSPIAAAAAPHDRTKRSLPNPALLRKLTKMVSSKEWQDIDALLRSPSEMAAYKSDFEVARSFRWQKLPNDILGLTSSFESLSTDTSDVGSDVDSMHIVHFACRFNPPR